MSKVTVSRAGLGELDELVPLFDGYRVFYQQPSDPALARSYLEKRLGAGEYFGFLARDGAGKAIGFAMCTATYTSVGLKRALLLNDIFVDPSVRRSGAGAALMAAVEEFARETGIGRLYLFTARTNLTAQSVYKRAGWAEDTTFLRFMKTF
ncbi:MAG: GNAT family N-acetyltransferase [Alphaproteobacteria bacterium]|nr:GNAT family N-acetyltransferase [Alphaproteobacteria bacterium]